MNEVYETEPFSEVYSSLEKKEQEWIKKIKEQLVENLEVGKPLRYNWFREKKLDNKRLYFLINEKIRKQSFLLSVLRKTNRK